MSKNRGKPAAPVTLRDAGLATALKSGVAIAEFSPNGRIVTANQDFLDIVGYTLDEIAGNHHRMLVDRVYARSSEYADFWTGLAAGRRRIGEFKQLRKDGTPAFLKASYMPVHTAQGQVKRVVMAAWDVTQDQVRALDAAGQIQAISRSQAIAEFSMDGTVLTANRNFLDLMGYSLDEIRGKHHSIFVDGEYRNSAAYREFWDSLQRGDYQQAEFKRIGKGGRELWIQGSYNPILDVDDRPVKVVKYATDVTEQKRRNVNFESQIEAINNTQAVVGFNLDGEILDANQIFLDVMGYTSDEVRGRHHRMFVDPDYARSAEYTDFWRMLNDGRTQTGQFIRIAKDGTKRWLQASYTPIRDIDGHLTKVVKYATDLTVERRQRDEILEDLISTLSSSSEQILGISGALTNHARNTSESATTAAGRTEEVASAMQTVAGSAEELTTTVREISRQTADGSSKATHAKNESDKAKEMIEQLSESSNAIGKIIKTISSIAQQTNLLALNATIEAARAGEAGKGFAVVANEVKELAKQTATATDDITNRVEAIQAASETAVGSIKTISEVIDGLNEISMAIATAIEEQAGTTNELARIVADSATAVRGVSENITEVNDMAVQTLSAGQETEASAKGLGEVATKLGDTLARLKQV